MSQRLPYDQYLHDVRVISALLQQQLPGRRRDDHSEDSVAWLLMKYCWNFDPTQRPTCEDICKYFTCLLDTTERFLDIQAETSDNMPQVPAGLHLWEDMKRDGGKVNFSHIYHLLQEVSYFVIIISLLLINLHIYFLGVASRKILRLGWWEEYFLEYTVKWCLEFI